jgi:hypothetical protein
MSPASRDHQENAAILRLVMGILIPQKLLQIGMRSLYLRLLSSLVKNLMPEPAAT